MLFLLLDKQTLCLRKYTQRKIQEQAEMWLSKECLLGHIKFTFICVKGWPNYKSEFNAQCLSPMSIRTDLAIVDSINENFNDIFNYFVPYLSNKGINFGPDVLNCYWIVWIKFILHRFSKKIVQLLENAAPWKLTHSTTYAKYLIFRD